jgi:hypothetical protein
MDELQRLFDVRVKELLNQWWDLEEMAHGCAFCGSHDHVMRKCDAPPSEMPGLIPWLDAQKERTA